MALSDCLLGLCLGNALRILVAGCASWERAQCKELSLQPLDLSIIRVCRRAALQTATRATRLIDGSLCVVQENRCLGRWLGMGWRAAIVALCASSALAGLLVLSKP